MKETELVNSDIASYGLTLISDVLGTTCVMRVTFDERGLRVNEQSCAIAAGAFDFWRHNPLFWGRILDRMIEAGLEIVSTFICWDFHEIDRGKFDFTGKTNPSRDLAGWLDLCASKGLKVMLRVGPVIDDGWPSRGPPVDVCQKERTDPLFLTRAKGYLDALGEVVGPRQARAGGPIIAIGLDNEVYFPYTIDLDEELTAGNVLVPYNEDYVLREYRRWLKRKYDTIGALRRSWGVSYRAWQEVRTPDYRRDSSPQTMDSFKFIDTMTLRYFRQLRKMCRNAGMDGPTFTNTRQFNEYWDSQALERVIDSQGVSTYMSRDLPGDEGLVLIWYYRLQQARKKLLWAAEFQAGMTIGDDARWGIQDSSHLRYFSQLAMALGLRGANWFMFVERDDWHWSPVSGIGKLRPQYEVMKDSIRILKRLRPGRPIADVGLLWFLSHNRAFMAEKYGRWTKLHAAFNDLRGPKEFPSWWSTFRALVGGDVGFVLVDPRGRARISQPVLVYAGPGFVNAREWERVTLALENGASMVAVTQLPLSDDVTFRPSSEVLALTQRIENTGRVRICAPSRVPELSRILGATRYISARPHGLWTTIFEGQESWTVSVINPGPERLAARVSLSPTIFNERSSYDIEALVSKHRWRADGTELLELHVTLEKKSAEIFLIEPSGSRVEESS